LGRPRTRHRIAAAGDIAPGGRAIVDVAGHSIGVFNVGGRFVAVLNACPHQLAPVCRGRVSGTTAASAAGTYVWGREGEILSCPWHGWEFDLLTGRALADGRRKLRTFETVVADGAVYVIV
jgi:nitrite reductase/ring-hydroxylating ferredoxin subunit